MRTGCSATPTLARSESSGSWLRWRVVLPSSRAACDRRSVATVAYSLVHSGVHYPGDADVGSLVGGALGSAGRDRRAATRAGLTNVTTTNDAVYCVLSVVASSWTSPVADITMGSPMTSEVSASSLTGVMAAKANTEESLTPLRRDASERGRCRNLSRRS